MNTATTSTLQELHNEIVRLRAELRAVAADFGLAVAAVGMAPEATDDDFELTMRGRFSRMHEEYRLLVDEQLICGYQVHVGVERPRPGGPGDRPSREALPTLLALSASSPFWRGRDTGYASMRTMIWQRWPTSGGFGRLETMAEYEGLIADLVRTGVISDAKMAYFDVRPSAHVPTLELRVCDACPLVDDAVLIAGLFRAAVAQAAERRGGGPSPCNRPGAGPARRHVAGGPQRPGRLSCSVDGAAPQPRPAVEVVRDLVTDGCGPSSRQSGDWETVKRAGRGRPGPGRLGVTAAGPLRRAGRDVRRGAAPGRRDGEPPRLPAAASCAAPRDYPASLPGRGRHGRRGRRPRRTGGSSRPSTP